MKKISFALVLVLSLVLGGLGAQAGEILRLKATGEIHSGKFPSLMASEQVGDAGLFLVQWKSAVNEEEKSELTRLGLEILSYIPDDAFLVQGDLTNAIRAAELAFVRTVVPYEAGMKVEAELTKNGVFGFQDEARISLLTAPQADLGQIKSLLKNPSDLGHGLILGSIRVGEVWKIARRPDVLWIERSLPLRTLEMKGSELVGVTDARPFATQTGYESGTKVLNIEALYDQGFHGEGQVVAVADTGLDSGNMSSLIADFQGQVKAGFAMGLGGASWGDPMSHGTHVSGSILGSGRNSNGLIRGGAYGAKLVMEGMWSDIMNNIMPPAIPKLFDVAYKEGARIHSDSWGAPNSNGRYDNWAVLTDTWLFDHPDFLAIFAAGNDGADGNRDGIIDQGSVASPGSAKNVLTVGASKNLLLEGGIQKPMNQLRNGAEKWGVEPIASSRLSEDIRGMAAFSSRGPTADGRWKPEIVAPGTNIVSARSRHPKADPATQSWGIYDDHYVYMGGTSMATPVAAGSVALVRQFLQQKLGTTEVSAALLKATTANAAEDLFPGQFGERSQGQEQPSRRPNNHQGWGRVNLASVANRTFALVDERVGLATGQAKEFTVSVQDSSQPLRITMAYTDAPGTASAARTLVNDLDLSLVDPSGRIIFPNGRDEKDSVNNMEEIDVFQPAGGNYRVWVKGANVPQGKKGAQPYALVISTGP